MNMSMTTAEWKRRAIAAENEVERLSCLVELLKKELADETASRKRALHEAYKDPSLRGYDGRLSST